MHLELPVLTLHVGDSEHPTLPRRVDSKVHTWNSKFVGNFFVDGRQAAVTLLRNLLNEDALVDQQVKAFATRGVDFHAGSLHVVPVELFDQSQQVLCRALWRFAVVKVEIQRPTVANACDYIRC